MRAQTQNPCLHVSPPVPLKVTGALPLHIHRTNAQLAFSAQMTYENLKPSMPKTRICLLPPTTPGPLLVKSLPGPRNLGIILDINPANAVFQNSSLPPLLMIEAGVNRLDCWDNLFPGFLASVLVLPSHSHCMLHRTSE